MTEAAGHAIDPSASVERYDRVTQAVYDAIDEVNESPGLAEPLEKSPESVLIGCLDSLSFVTFLTSLEENLQRTLGATISVVDLLVDDLEHCTVGMLTDRIADWIDSSGRG